MTTAFTSGLYAIDGSINVNVVSGSSYTGVMGDNGAFNVIASSGSSYVGAYNPCGALWVTLNSSPVSSIRAADGSLNVSVSSYQLGTQEVTVLTGSFAGDFIYTDGAAAPTPNLFYDSGTNTTWMAYEDYNALYDQKFAVVATYDHATKTWNGNYVGGTQTLSDDTHGTPLICADSSGRVYMIYGAHSSKLFVSWVGNLTTGIFETPIILPTVGTKVTFPSLYSVGTNTLYLFYNTQGVGLNDQDAFVLQIGTTSTTGITWSSAVTLIDSASSGQQGWFPVWEDSGVVSGSSIHFVGNYGLGNPGVTLTNNYYFIYNTVNGTVSNYAGTHSDASAAQPISLTSLNTNYSLYSGTQIGTVALAIDNSSNSHIVINDKSSGVSVNKYIIGTSASFSTPISIYTYGVNKLATGFLLVPNVSSSNLDLYFSDGSFASSANAAGNIIKMSRSGGSWGTTSTVQTYLSVGSGNYGLDVSEINLNGESTSFQVSWGQVSNDYITTVGSLLGTGYGSGNFISRSNPILQPPVGTSQLDVDNMTVGGMTTSSFADVNNVWAIAVQDPSLGANVIRGTTSLNTGKVYIEVFVPSTNSASGNVAIGCVNSSFLTDGSNNMFSGNSNSFCVFDTGAVRVGGSSSGTVNGYAGFNILVGMALDFDNKKFWTKVGTSGNWNNASLSTQNPTTDTGGISFSSVSGPFYPCIEIDKANYEALVSLGNLYNGLGPPPGFSVWG